MVEIMEFDRDKGYVIFETPQSKMRLTLEEWRHISGVYYRWVGLPLAKRFFEKARNEVRRWYNLDPM